MGSSLLFNSRIWHRRIASLLFVFFFFIAVTGVMLGWKSFFTKTVFENKQVAASSFKTWLPLDSLESLATDFLNQQSGQHFTHADRIDIRPRKAYLNFTFPKDYYIQVDGATGAPILIEKKNGGWIQDIHDGAIVDGWLTNKSGAAKKIYSTVLGLALLFLTLSGFYLWYKPKQIKQAKKRI